MLLRIREVTAGKFSYFIVALITVPLALWGISSYFQGAFDPVVIEIDSVKVTLSQFNQEFNQRKRSFAASVDESQMPSDNAIKQEVASIFISEGLAAHNADEYDYRIPDNVLAEAILQMPEFWVDNKFDKQLYVGALKARQLTQSRFEENIRDALRKGKLRRVIEESSFILPYEDAAYEQFLFEERRGRYIKLPMVNYIKPGSIPSTRAVAYYLDNEEKFMTADTFVLEYIELNVEDIAAELVLEMGEPRSYYDQNAELFSAPEQRRFAHILIDPDRHGDDASRERADEVYGKLERGEDFSDLAKEYSDDSLTAEVGGELPPLLRDDLDSDIADAIFVLNAGEFSKPIETPFGLQMFKLLAIEPGISKPFEKVRDEIEERLKLDLAEPIYGEAVEQLEFLSYEYPDSLDEVSSQIEIAVVKSTTRLDVGNRDDLLAYPKIRTAVYSEQVLESRENSEAIEVEEGHVFVVRIAEEGYEPGRQQTLEEVKSKITETLLEQDAWVSAAAAAEAMLKRLQEKETTLDELSQGNSQGNSQAIGEIDFVRRDHQGVYHSGMVGALFSMLGVVGSYTISLGSEASYAVIELLEIRQGEFLPIEKPDLARGTEEYQAALSAMLERTPVELDSETIVNN